MSVKLSIKIDSNKLRIYLNGDTGEIRQYLKNKNYAEVLDAVLIEQNKINQAKLRLDELKEEEIFQSITIRILELAEPGPVIKNLVDDFSANFSAQQEVEQEACKNVTGYSVPYYNLAYSAGKSSIMVDFWLPIIKHFNDDSLMYALSKLLKPLDLACGPETTPNMQVKDLKSRQYVTIFPETDTNPELALQVIHEFESLALGFAKNELGSDLKTIPSKVNVSFEPFPQAIHLLQLGIFGSASTSTSGGSSGNSTQPASNSNSNTSPSANVRY